MVAPNFLGGEGSGSIILRAAQTILATKQRGDQLALQTEQLAQQTASADRAASFREREFTFRERAIDIQEKQFLAQQGLDQLRRDKLVAETDLTLARTAALGVPKLPTISSSERNVIFSKARGFATNQMVQAEFQNAGIPSMVIKSPEDLQQKIQRLQTAIGDPEAALFAEALGDEIPEETAKIRENDIKRLSALQAVADSDAFKQLTDGSFFGSQTGKQLLQQTIKQRFGANSPAAEAAFALGQTGPDPEMDEATFFTGVDPAIAENTMELLDQGNPSAIVRIIRGRGASQNPKQKRAEIERVFRMLQDRFPNKATEMLGDIARDLGGKAYIQGETLQPSGQ